MIRITVLGSGSKGNAILVDGTAGSLLVDAGFGVRTLAKRFEAAARAPEEVGALLLTHEHVDHACGAGAASDRWSWTVHASEATHAALAVQASGAPSENATLAPSGEGTLCGFVIAHAPLPHDASDCRAFVLTDVASGARAGIVLDAGHVPESLPGFLDRLDLLVVESNHCRAMLADGPYPWSLKQRIGGGRGHLSNAAATELTVACAHRGLQAVVLAHLSETNNTPDLALGTMRDGLGKTAWQGAVLVAAAQRVPLEPVQVAARSTSARTRKSEGTRRPPRSTRPSAAAAVTAATVTEATVTEATVTEATVTETMVTETMVTETMVTAVEAPPPAQLLLGL